MKIEVSSLVSQNKACFREAARVVTRSGLGKRNRSRFRAEQWTWEISFTANLGVWHEHHGEVLRRAQDQVSEDFVGEGTRFLSPRRFWDWHLEIKLPKTD